MANRIGDTVAKMVLEQCQSNPLQSAGGCGNLGQNVNAVGVIFDHPLDSSNLTLHSSKAF
jgi:hypothetical protein